MMNRGQCLLGAGGEPACGNYSIGKTMWCLIAGMAVVLGWSGGLGAASASISPDDSHWVGTWAAAPQSSPPGAIETLSNQTLRLIVHTSLGGKKVRIRVSNVFGDQPLAIGAAHIARRTAEAKIDPSSDRALTFGGQKSAVVGAGSLIVSDPVDLDVPALSDLAVSIFFPKAAEASTLHLLALQTNYVATGDLTAQADLPAPEKITSWPFLSGLDVVASPGAAAIVAFGSSTTDGDGSTVDANHRWPDLLAERLQKDGGEHAELGVLNEGIIGNRLLSDNHSPRQAGGPFAAVLQQFGDALGQAGMSRFDRDVLQQSGVRYVIFALGVNDMLFPGSFIPATESVNAQSLIRGYRELIARARKNGIRVIATTIPPFENATFRGPVIHFYTPEKDRVREEFNQWIRSGGEFDGVADFDKAVRDPNHPSQLLPAYDSGDHLHVNDAGNAAQANAISLELLGQR